LQNRAIVFSLEVGMPINIGRHNLIALIASATVATAVATPLAVTCPDSSDHG